MTNDAKASWSSIPILARFTVWVPSGPQRKLGMGLARPLESDSSSILTSGSFSVAGTSDNECGQKFPRAKVPTRDLSLVREELEN